MSGIGIVTNPHSKRNRLRPQTPKLLGYILGEHGMLEVTESLEALATVAEKFCQADIEILAINGGDGTISRTLSAMRLAYEAAGKPMPKIALLRGGTMNVLANYLKIKGSPENILFRLCQAYSEGQQLATRSVPLLVIDQKICGVLYADGLSYHVLHEFYKNKTGPCGAAWLIFKIILSALFGGDLYRRLAQTETIDLQIDRQPMGKISCLTLFASTIPHLPYGIPFFRHLKQQSGVFEALVVHVEPQRLLRSIFSILFWHKVGVGRAKSIFLAKNLQLRAQPGYTYSLDGELYESSSGQITIQRGESLEFICL